MSGTSINITGNSNDSKLLLQSNSALIGSSSEDLNINNIIEDLRYQILFNTYGRELYELTELGENHWKNNDSKYETFGSPKAGLVGTLIEFRIAPFMFPRCINEGFLKLYTDFSKNVIQESRKIMASGHFARYGGYITNSNPPNNETRLSFNDFLFVSEGTFNGTNPFNVLKPLNNGLDVRTEALANDMASVGAIFSKNPYKNYEIEFDFKHTDYNSYQMPGWGTGGAPNSGIFFHGQINPNIKESLFYSTLWYQLQTAIIPNKTGKELGGFPNIGSVFGGNLLKLPSEDSTGFVWYICNNIKITQEEMADYIHFKLVIEGNTLMAYINGVKVTWDDATGNSIDKITNLKVGEGFVGFEYEESDINAKNIYIRPLQ